MAIHFAGVIVAILLMFLGEKLPNETKKTYIEAGHSWSKVLIYSNSISIMLGLTSIVTLYVLDLPNNLNLQVLPFAVTIVSYITIQSLMTDLKVLLINRNILRVAYISMYIISIYNIFSNEVFLVNLSALGIFTGVLIFIFLFSSIGASDVRALAVALPYVISIGGYTAIHMLVVTLFATAGYMAVKREKVIKDELVRYKYKYEDMYNEMGEKEFNIISRRTIKGELAKSEEHAMPVGPFMIMPFLAFLMIYPITI